MLRTFHHLTSCDNRHAIYPLNNFDISYTYRYLGSARRYIPNYIVLCNEQIPVPCYTACKDQDSRLHIQLVLCQLHRCLCTHDIHCLLCGNYRCTSIYTNLFGLEMHWPGCWCIACMIPHSDHHNRFLHFQLCMLDKWHTHSENRSNIFRRHTWTCICPHGHHLISKVHILVFPYTVYRFLVVLECTVD